MPTPLAHSTARRAGALLLMLAAALALAGCNRAAETGAAALAASGGVGVAAGGGAAPGAAASAPPVGVTTVRAQQRDLPVLINANGTVAPLSSVEVRPQTTSLVSAVHVSEGQFVRKGTLLFTLDARADQANVAKAQAQLVQRQAALADAQRQLARSRDLLAQNFISQGAVDTNQTAVDTQQALAAADRAALDAARLALSYARISAPSAGRLGAINVYPGTSVTANQTVLATVTQLDPIAVAFSLPQRNLADALAALKDGGAAVSAMPPNSAAGKAASPLAGRLKFVDSTVDAATGTVRAKAEFANPDGTLWPGAFVNVALTAGTLAGAVVVPQAAIIQSARGPTVYVVQDNKAQQRPVRVLYAQGEDAAVSGVRGGERVVLDGRQNLRPGSTVVERDPTRPPGRAASAPGPEAGNGRSAAP